MTGPNGLTISIVTVAQALEQMFRDNMADVGLKAVYYGDQDKIATTPALCVEPATKANNLRISGGGFGHRMVDPTINIDLLLYHGAVASTQNNRLEADQFAERCETLIHSNRTLGDIVINGYVTDLESGYSRKTNTLYRTTRLAYECTTQGLLPS